MFIKFLNRISWCFWRKKKKKDSKPSLVHLGIFDLQENKIHSKLGVIVCRFCVLVYLFIYLFFPGLAEGNVSWFLVCDLSRDLLILWFLWCVILWCEISWFLKKPVQRSFIAVHRIRLEGRMIFIHYLYSNKEEVLSWRSWRLIKETWGITFSS